MAQSEYKCVYAYRACKILQDFLVANRVTGRVLLPANVCTDVNDTIVAAGAIPVFADIDRITLCLDEQVMMDQAPKMDAIIFVHTYGVEIELTPVFQKLKALNSRVLIIDDKCLCWPSFSADCTTEADLVLYSTGAKKQLDLGGGGYGIVRSRLAKLMGHSEKTLSSPELLRLKTGDYQELIERRERVYRIYRDNLPYSIQLPKQFQQWRFNIWVDNKDEILNALFTEGLFASGHYKSLYPDCYNAIQLHEHVINLFEDHFYTEEQARQTCEVINRYIP